MGQHLNSTKAIVSKGIRRPPAIYELHCGPSPEAMVTGVGEGGAKPDFADVPNANPDKGNTLARAVDHLRRK